ncbi:MAG: hypothetical protein K2X49_16600 [Acetobacteraceae bacterium]|nr:hypothetical protein [Acetobacteraceae bacterium]
MLVLITGPDFHFVEEHLSSFLPHFIAATLVFAVHVVGLLACAGFAFQALESAYRRLLGIDAVFGKPVDWRAGFGLRPASLRTL